MNPGESRHERRKRWKKLRTAAELSSIGLTLALSIGIGIGIGIWLENRFPSRGMWVIGFTLVGIAAGFKQLIQGLIKAGREAEAEERDARSESGSERNNGTRGG